MIKIKNKINNRGQITIFVIIAIIIIASIALLLFRKTGVETISARENPQTYFDKCMSDAANKILDSMTENTGIGDKTGVRVFRYNGTNVAYLCYTDKYNVLCTNEHPMLNKEIEQEITTLIKPEVEKCLLKLKNELSKYEYSEESIGQLVNVSIIPKKVVLDVNKKISYLRNDAKVSFNLQEISLDSSLFEFIKIQNSIIKQELDCNCNVETCNADTIVLSRENRNFEITKPVYTQKGKIYRILDVNTNQIFQFAIRNCVRGES